DGAGVHDAKIPCAGGAAYFAPRMTSPTSATLLRPAEGRNGPHVLFLPKWYPGRNDPQLGDFLRKQALAVAAEMKVSVLFIAPVTEADSEELTEVDGAWELRCYYKASESSIRPWRKAVNFIRYCKAATRGWERIMAERGLPDIIHAYILVRPVMLAWWMKKRRDVPYIVSEQSSEYLDGTYARKGMLFKAWSRMLTKGAAGVTAVSAWLGDALVEHGLCADYTVVPNVVPGLDRPLPPPGSAGRFLVVADLVDRTKNVSGVIRALARARAQDPRIELTVIGDGPDRRALEELARSQGVNGAIRFLGRMPNSAVLDQVAQAAAMIVNSNVETFSVVTGEALAQGRPVIATRCGGPVAFITPANGTLIEPKDDQALSVAMLEMTRHAERYDGAAIRADLSDRFSPQRVARLFREVYAKALQHEHR
ncbi:MAG TPA: glycosyltransferase, partial [Flavobacteriales bacterium]|nr:glycosyltransferase [Flavobacteriales bacterium]